MYFHGSNVHPKRKNKDRQYRRALQSGQYALDPAALSRYAPMRHRQYPSTLRSSGLVALVDVVSTDTPSTTDALCVLRCGTPARRLAIVGGRCHLTVEVVGFVLTGGGD